MAGLTAAQRLVNSRSAATAEHDFYPTPPEATWALLEAVPSWPEPIHEGACGDGAMVRVLQQYGRHVIATDLIDRGYGAGGQDFLQIKEPMGRSFVTNPPFKLATRFARHALSLGYEKVALLSRINFLNGTERSMLYALWPPKEVLVFPWRLQFARSDYKGKAKPMGDHCWIVWDRTHPSDAAPTIRWLTRPKGEG